MSTLAVAEPASLQKCTPSGRQQQQGNFLAIRLQRQTQEKLGVKCPSPFPYPPILLLALWQYLLPWPFESKPSCPIRFFPQVLPQRRGMQKYSPQASKSVNHTMTAMVLGVVYCPKMGFESSDPSSGSCKGRGNSKQRGWCESMVWVLLDDDGYVLAA